MAKPFIIKIDSIIGGMGPATYAARKGQFLTSIAIDPDMPADGGAVFIKGGGVITPVGYSKFSASVIDSNPVVLITSPKNTQTIYAVLLSGKLVSYAYSEASGLGSFSSETSLSATGGGGGGGFYYNNYIYIPGATDVDRWGPLDGSATRETNIWTGATLGSLTALISNTYPTLGIGVAPQHHGHVHVDGAAYFMDYKNGQGLIHKIKTKKVTAEGDTNDGSAYNVLDLPFGYYPMDIESYGNDLVIAAIQAGGDTSINIKQANAALFFWDTFSPSFYRQIDLNAQMVSALANRNGELLVWHGWRSAGYMISRYWGGMILQNLHFLDEGHPPLAPAIDVFGGRVSWGTSITYPSTAAVVMALGSKDPNLPPNALHNIARISSTGTSPGITALKYIQNVKMGAVPRFVMAWVSTESGLTARGLDNLSLSATLNSELRSPVISLGQPFQIKKVRFGLSGPVAANQIITPQILVDEESTTYGSSNGLTVINNTNYANSERQISMYPTISGKHNFILDLLFTGSSQLSVLLPIIIEGELLDD